jgi:NADH:ubiquinone oxidoreductase subunit 2 (subunit N)
MTILVALVIVGTLGAAGSAWGMARGERTARIATIGGLLALILVAILALALDASPVTPGPPTEQTLFDGRLAPNAYLRLVIALWALDGLLIAGVGAISDGWTGLRGLLPATLTAIVGGTLAFAARDLTLAAAAAGITGLAAMVVMAAAKGPSVVIAGARELRVSLLGPALLIAVAAAAPVAAAIVLRGVTAGADQVGAGDEAGGAIGLLALASALVIAVRYGVIPFHVRVPRLADTVPHLSLPLLLAWIPVPVAVVGLAITDRVLLPLGLPLDGERAIVVGVVLVSLLATALGAFFQDDLRHAVGYLVIANGSLVLLGIAAFDSAAWGPARTWLVIVAVAMSALLAWSAVAESRFGTRSIPELRGWVRSSPVLAAALVVITIATFGIPGWRAFSIRADLANLATPSPWSWLLIVASLATLPTYLRLLVVGAGTPTSTVSRAVPERIARGWQTQSLPIEREGMPATSSPEAPVDLPQAVAPVDLPQADVAGDKPQADAEGDASTDAPVDLPQADVAGDKPQADTAGDASPDDHAGDGDDATHAAAEAPDPTSGTAQDETVSSDPRRRRLRPDRASGATRRTIDGTRRLTTAIRRDSSILTASAVLALAILAALTSAGAFGIADAAAEPTSIVTVQSSD